MAWPISPAQGVLNSDVAAEHIYTEVRHAQNTAQVARTQAGQNSIDLELMRRLVMHCARARVRMDEVRSGEDLVGVLKGLARLFFERNGVTLSETQVNDAGKLVYNASGVFRDWALANFPKDTRGNLAYSRFSADGSATVPAMLSPVPGALITQLDALLAAFG